MRFACYQVENRPKGLERAEIERVVGITDFSNSNMTQILYRHPKVPPRRIAERRTADRTTDLRVTVSTAEGRAAALRVAGAQKRRYKNQEMPPPTKRAEVAAGATSVEVRSTLRTSAGACAEALSTGLAVVRSEELRRVRCWPK